jgi:cobalt-zinc-cadmium efflux system protein
MSTTETALTAHLTMPSGGTDDRFLAQVAEELRARFQIDHSTVQVEQGDAALACQQTCADD